MKETGSANTFLSNKRRQEMAKRKEQRKLDLEKRRKERGRYIVTKYI